VRLSFNFDPMILTGRLLAAVVSIAARRPAWAGTLKS
jgi:hypothetical protein